MHAITADEDAAALRRLIDWFHQSSLELTREYRRLEQRVARLSGELERKNQELEQSLREREQAQGYLLSVLESLKAGVLVLDGGLRPTLWNRHLDELSDGIDEVWVRRLLGESLYRHLAGGENHLLPLECERRIRGPQGAHLSLHLTISEVLLQGEQRSGYVLVLQDLSRIKRLEAEAARSRRLAALGEMAAEIAHQTRSPLGGIELYASLIREREAGEAKRLAGEILSAVQRLYTTTSRLLSFASEPSIHAEPLAVCALLREVEEMASSLFRDRRWELEIQVEDRLPPIWADRALVAQALFNLTANAVEAMPNGGKVTVRGQVSPHYSINGSIHRMAEIRVRDEGTGISHENRERIFDPFFTTKPQGTGLGLALAQKIVCAHNGSIEIASERGRGSEFILYLPVADVGEIHAEANCHSR